MLDRRIHGAWLAQVACACMATLLVAGPARGDASDGPLTVQLDAGAGTFGRIDDVVIRVEVINNSADLTLGLMTGAATWKDHVHVAVDGVVIPPNDGEATGSETYELGPDQSVDFFVPLMDYVLKASRVPLEVLARNYRGRYTVTVDVAGAESAPLTFEVTGQVDDQELTRRHDHAGLQLAASLREVLAVDANAAIRSGISKSVALNAVQQITGYLFEDGRDRYDEPLDMLAVAQLQALLRSAGDVHRDLRLTGEYLLGLQPVGTLSPELIEAVGFEREALQLIAAGRIQDGISKYALAFHAAPDEVLFHVSAVSQLSALGDAWTAQRDAIARQGIARIKSHGPDMQTPSNAFALGYLTAHSGKNAPRSE